MRASLALRRGDASTARASVDRAESHDGKNPDFDYLRGCALELEAQGAADPAARRAAHDAAAVAYLGALELLGQDGHEQVLLADPGNVFARLGAVLLAAGRPAEARAALETARRLGAGDRVRVAEAEALLLAGDAAGALRVVEPVLGDRPDGWFVAARAAQALGAGADARLFLAQGQARLGAGLASPQIAAPAPRARAGG